MTRSDPIRRVLVVLVLTALMAAACGSGTTGGTVASGGDGPTTTIAPGVVAEPGAVPDCVDISDVVAPDSAYRDAPIYVANEMPIEEVDAWAKGKPGYEGTWIDRDRNGWVTVAFTSEVEARQAELAAEFPDDGVVAVQVDWTDAELADLQQRITEELRNRVDSFSSGYRLSQGVVSIGFGVLTDERRALVAELFGGERVCVGGGDPADQPEPGPQPTEGDGWRLLVDAPGVGQPYRTGFATDEESLAELLAEIGLSGDAVTPADVDFEREVVVWFGPAVSGSCSEIRLDQVVVDGDRLHAEIVLPDQPAFCTDDANPHAYVVAIERPRLPEGPFVIQVDADGPPAGAPEEITRVDADLAIVEGEPAPAPDGGAPDRLPAFLEPGYPRSVEIDTHCGVEWLVDVNDTTWRADSVTETPDAWLAAAVDEWLVVEMFLDVDPETLLLASAAGVTVEYRPTTEAAPGCD